MFICIFRYFLAAAVLPFTFFLSRGRQLNSEKKKERQGSICERVRDCLADIEKA